MNTVTVINHTNGTWHTHSTDLLRYFDFSHNRNDVIEIHWNKEATIPKGYREHKPHIFPADLVTLNSGK